jgi:hypothetical protein
MKRSILLLITLVLTNPLFCQSKPDNDYKIINDVICDILSKEITCFYLMKASNFSLIHKSDYSEYFEKFRVVLGDNISKELLDSVTKKYAKPDTLTFWTQNHINNSILLSWNDLEAKIFKYIYYDTIPVRESSAVDCKTFQVIEDSSNITTIYDTISNAFVNSTLLSYFRIRRIPKEFNYVYIISKPIINVSRDYAIFFYCINPRTLRGFGSCVICKKVRNKWIILKQYAEWSS